MNESTLELFHKQGYLIIPDVLSEEQVQQARAGLNSSPSFKERERTRHIQLLSNDKIRFIAVIPAIYDLAKKFLGDDCLLSGFSSHELPPDAGGMKPHIDYPYFCMESLPPPYPMIQLQSIWMLDDFTEINGATRVVPGSHLKHAKPNFEQEAIPVLGKAGSVIISHGMLWHATGKNTTKDTRSAILVAFVPKWVHPLEKHGMTNDMLNSLSPDLQTLAGQNFSKHCRKEYQKFT
jgi:ectoine hydroxylase-related dioxygenase (phytanoyl-CoA dioxygenase family)